LRNRYHFDERYREDAELRDGTSVQLRLVRPGDRDLLRRGFYGLSTESRYLRFMGTKAMLTEAELEALTTLDGVDHFAIGAVRREAAGDREEGLGVARFVRLPGNPEVAEAAVTVADSVQGQGLGSLLLRRLAAAAREREIRSFRGDVLACNEAMRRLLAAHLAVTAEPDDDVLQVLVELPSFRTLMAAPGDGGDLLGRLLAYAAGGRMIVRAGDLLLKRS
jgi:GNAT superfamily N-acetyltransferase